MVITKHKTENDYGNRLYNLSYSSLLNCKKEQVQKVLV